MGSLPIRIAVGDLNLDGKLDMAVTNFFSDYFSVLIGNGTGGFAPAVNYTLLGCRAVSVGDFNRDGKPDLAAAQSSIAAPTNNVSIYLGDGSGTFNSSFSIGLVGASPSCLTVADFNSDGEPDVATANQNGNNISVLLNRTIQRSARFPQYKDFEVGEVPWFVASADLGKGIVGGWDRKFFAIGIFPGECPF